MLPVLAFPYILSNTQPDSELRLLTWFYPLYVIVSGLCAYICYPERTEITVILLLLMVLSHVALLFLV
jgi:hypothetical protein